MNSLKVKLSSITLLLDKDDYSVMDVDNDIDNFLITENQINEIRKNNVIRDFFSLDYIYENLLDKDQVEECSNKAVCSKTIFCSIFHDGDFIYESE